MEWLQTYVKAFVLTGYLWRGEDYSRAIKPPEKWGIYLAEFITSQLENRAKQ